MSNDWPCSAKAKRLPPSRLLTATRSRTSPTLRTPTYASASSSANTIQPQLLVVSTTLSELGAEQKQAMRRQLFGIVSGTQQTHELIERSCFASEYEPDELLRASLQDIYDATIYMLKDRGVAVGYVNIRKMDRSLAFMNGLCIAHEFRKFGYGTWFMTEVMRRLFTAGMNTVHFRVIKDAHMFKRLAFYDRLPLSKSLTLVSESDREQEYHMHIDGDCMDADCMRGTRNIKAAIKAIQLTPGEINSMVTSRVVVNR